MEQQSENNLKSDRFTKAITKLGIRQESFQNSIQDQKNEAPEESIQPISPIQKNDVLDVIAENMQYGLVKQRKATLTPIMNPKIRKGATMTMTQIKKSNQKSLKISQYLKNVVQDITRRFFRKKTEHHLQVNLSKHQLRILKDKTISFEKKPWNVNKMNDEKALLKEEIFASSNLRKIQSLSFKFTAKDSKEMSSKDKFLKMLSKVKAYVRTPISPDNTYKMLWDISAAFFIVYEMILTPFKISFSVDDTAFMSTFELIIDIYFLIDICLNFYTAYYDKGNVIYAKGAIIKNYLKFWFWIDLVASFPYNQITPDADNPDTYSSHSNNRGALSHSASIVKLLRIFRFIKVVKLLRLAKLRRVLDILQSYFTLPAWILDIFKVIMVVFTFAHWLGCVWHFLAVSEGTMYETTWVTKKGIIDQSVYVQYVSSLYWATLTMTTVGYGDSVPVTPLEASMSTVTNVISGVLFAYTMNKVNSILTGDDEVSESHRDSILLMTNYMRKHQVPIWLQIRIKTYLKYTGENESSLNDHKKVVHKYLNEAFREELLFEAMGKFLLEKRIFRDFEPVFLRKVISIMEEKMFSPEDTVFLEGSTDDLSLYYINSGKIQIFMIDSETTIKNLTVGECFGEIGFFTGMGRTASARAMDFSSLYYINRDKFLSLLDMFPEDKEKYCEKKDKVAIIGNLSWILVACYACQSQGHIAKYCPKLHYVVQKDQFLQEHFASHEDFCKKYVRKIQQKTRFSLKQIQDGAKKFRQKTESLNSPSEELLKKAHEDEKPKIRVNPTEKGLTPLMRFRKVARLIQFQARIGLMAKRTNYFEVGFDKVANFTYYFTHNNIEYIFPVSRGFSSEIFHNIDSPLLPDRYIKKTRKSIFAPNKT